MSESWKNRLCSLVLVCTFAVVLSVCQKTSDSSSSSVAYADFKPSDVTAVMHCTYTYQSSGVTYFKNCDSSESTALDSTDSYSITLDDLVNAGFRPCDNSAAANSGNSIYGSFMFCY